MRIILFFFISLVLPNFAVAQYSIEGEIRDSEKDQYLPFAHVRVAGSGHGTAANSEGHFRLDVDSLRGKVFLVYLERKHSLKSLVGGD